MSSPRSPTWRERPQAHPDRGADRDQLVLRGGRVRPRALSPGAPGTDARGRHERGQPRPGPARQHQRVPVCDRGHRFRRIVSRAAGGAGMRFRHRARQQRLRRTAARIRADLGRAAGPEREKSRHGAWFQYRSCRHGPAAAKPRRVRSGKGTRVSPGGDSQARGAKPTR